MSLQPSEKPSKLISERQHPVWNQILADTKALGRTQVFIPLGMAAATFIVNLWRGEVVSVPSALAWLGISVVIGFVLYFLAAVVRAPFVVIGHLSEKIVRLEASVRALQSTLGIAPEIIVRLRE